MPSTGPRPADIAFDQAAAAAAVAALDRARSVLDDVSGARVRAAATARKEFRGVYAEDFGRTDQELGRASGDAAGTIAVTRSAIAEAMAAARVAQAARVGEQQAWDDEHAHPAPVGVA